MNNNRIDKYTMQGFFAGAASRMRADSPGLLRALLCAGLALSAMAAQAQDQAEPPVPLQQRFPAGSIKSEQAARDALDQAAHDRAASQDQYLLEQRACYKKFLVNDCLEKAKSAKRVSDKGIKQVEIEANTWRRQAQVDERDHSLAEQHAKDQEDAARRLADQKKQQAASARKLQDSRSKDAQIQQRRDQAAGQPADLRVREHDAKVKQQQAEEAARAPERAANAAKREQRVRDAEQHRQEVARKKADAERDRAQKKAQQAVPPAAPAVPATR